MLDVALPDRRSGLMSRIFAAICGIVVSAMRAAGPDHGAGSQGMHSMSAVHGIANVSVLFLGHHALSDLQWPLRIGTMWCRESSRYMIVPSCKETEGPASRL